MQALTTANKYPATLFSVELFSDTRLSQQPAGGVLKYSEDWLAGVQRSSRQKKPLKSSTILNAFMQNKPNLCRFYAKNPDSAQKRTQTNPIQTQFKPIFTTKNQPQTQIKPNTNPISVPQNSSMVYNAAEIYKGVA